MDHSKLEPWDTANPPIKTQGSLLCAKGQDAGPAAAVHRHLSFHTHCSCVSQGWRFGKRPGSGRARKTRRLPLDKSNIYTGLETAVLCTSCSRPSLPGRPAPSLSSIQGLQSTVWNPSSWEVLCENSQEEAPEASALQGQSSRGWGGCWQRSRPRWPLWGLDRGLLGLQVPGGPRLGFKGGWLIRGQMPATAAAWGPFKAAGRIGVLV